MQPVASPSPSSAAGEIPAANRSPESSPESSPGSSSGPLQLVPQSPERPPLAVQTNAKVSFIVRQVMILATNVIYNERHFANLKSAESACSGLFPFFSLHLGITHEGTNSTHFIRDGGTGILPSLKSVVSSISFFTERCTDSHTLLSAAEDFPNCIHLSLARPRAEAISSLHLFKNLRSLTTDYSYLQEAYERECTFYPQAERNPGLSQALLAELEKQCPQLEALVLNQIDLENAPLRAGIKELSQKKPLLKIQICLNHSPPPAPPQLYSDADVGFTVSQIKLKDGHYTLSSKIANTAEQALSLCQKTAEVHGQATTAWVRIGNDLNLLHLDNSVEQPSDLQAIQRATFEFEDGLYDPKKASLVQLVLSGAVNLQDVAIHGIGSKALACFKLQRIKTLTINNSRFKEIEAFVTRFRGTKPPELEPIDNKTCRGLLKDMPKLTKLTLEGCPEVSDGLITYLNKVKNGSLQVERKGDMPKVKSEDQSSKVNEPAAKRKEINGKDEKEVNERSEV